MDFLSLTVFCAVAREQSVTRAAALLGRAPSNITTRLRQMEAELGVPLFERQTKRMLLSAQGRIYLEYAQRMLTLAEDAKMAVQPAHTATTLRWVPWSARWQAACLCHWRGLRRRGPLFRSV
ncbi:LysR family transcriptional regulator [Acetobacter okinawensis]|uniref:LysR family transcriptional regulator n=1 Tax=Acetobacter okinawensis TaxID=1076594 RepID=UPI000AB07E8D|nr:LysR family transcriptional regulator [Acetobacter okinawensis]